MIDLDGRKTRQLWEQDLRSSSPRRKKNLSGDHPFEVRLCIYVEKELSGDNPFEVRLRIYVNLASQR